MVGAMSITYTKPLRRLVAERSSSGSTPGARMPDDREARAAPRRRRTHDEHRVVRRVDVGEHAADQLVGAVERGLLLDAGLVVGEELGVEVGAQQVGPLDQHDAAGAPRVRRRRGRRRRCPCAHRRARADRVRAARRPPRRRGRGRRSPSSALTAARWNSGSGSSTTGCAPSPLAMTARGTRCLASVVTERADRRVVEAVGVLLHQGVDAQVHEAAGRGHAGALPVDVARGALAVGLAGLEGLRGERRDRRGAAPGTQRGVPAGDGALAAGGARDHVGDGRLRQQLLEVRVVPRLDVGPRRRRQRDHQHALHRGGTRWRRRRSRVTRRRDDEDGER